MTELSKGLAKLVCLIKVKAGEDGKMFGAVTAGMIADELKHQFDVTLDKRKIHLEHPIKTLGEHEVELHLHAEVKGTLKVRVESTTPAPVVEAAPAAEAPRTEKRGKRVENVEAPKPKAGKSDKAAPTVERKPKTDKATKAE